MNTLPESTQKYYQTKVNLIYNKVKDKIYSNAKDYEAFMNVPFAKSMIRFKFDFDLQIEQTNVLLSGFNNSLSEDDIIEMVVDEGLTALISSSIQKLKPNQYRDVYLTEYLTESSSSEIKAYLDYAVNFQFKNQMDKQLNSIKYLYFGEKHMRFISQIVKLSKTDGYCAEYEGIKFFYIDILEDIYLSNASFMDINSMDIRYNEYIKEEFSDLFDVDVLYENVPDLMKKGVLTLNCYLGDVNVVKLKCHFGNGKVFYRKLKLSRILKNEIHI